MTAFDHPPDAACTCSVCGYHRALPLAAPPPVNDTIVGAIDEADEPIPAVAKLREAHVGGREQGTIYATRLSREEKRAGALVVYPDVERPQTRGDCVDGPRPCPFVSCRWHLYLDVLDSGSIKINHVDREPWELDDSCALDVADDGGATLDRVGALMGITRERVRQIEAKATRRVARNAELRREAA